MGTAVLWATALVDKIRSDPGDVVQTVLVLARRDLLDIVAGMTIYLAVLVLFVISIWRPRGVVMRIRSSSRPNAGSGAGVNCVAHPGVCRAISTRQKQA